jgi:hypothetical protein
MRLLIGVMVGLLIGFGLGLFGISYWQSRYTSVAEKADRKTAPSERPFENYYVCQSDTVKTSSALIIRGNGDHATQMVFPWKTDGDLFDVDHTTDLHYLASDTVGRAVAENVADLNRVTGDLYIITRLSPGAVQLLASICRKQLPYEDCVPGMERLGGSSSDCTLATTDFECEKLTAGNSFRGRYHWVCAASERRF